MTGQPFRSQTPAIEISELRRVYREEGRRSAKSPPRVALDSVSLTVPSGEIHGLLGPNGAGKTTLVKILCTVLLPTSGTVRVVGHDVVKEAAEVRRLVGVAFGGERGLQPLLTAEQMLNFWGRMYGMSKEDTRTRTAEMLALFGLSDRADSRIRSYSRGMKQRLHLARALLPRPRLLFLDEPTIGVDPVARRDFRRLLAGLYAEGITVMITTHDMAEAEAVCDRVTLIDSGRILATEAPETLSRWLSTYGHIEVKDASEATLDLVRMLPEVTQVRQLDTGVARVEVSAERALREVLTTLVASGCVQVRLAAPALDEVYMALVEEKRLMV